MAASKSTRRTTKYGSIPWLRQAITVLDTNIASLLKQRCELETFLEKAVRSQSPVNRMPNELLSLVFESGVLDVNGEGSLMVSTLMLVCRLWRDVAVETSSLWSRISVTPQDSLERARLQLSRSKSSPLDIRINLAERVDMSRITERVALSMDLFRPVLSRTRSLHLQVPSRAQAHAALLRCQENAPLLQDFSVRIAHCIQDNRYGPLSLPLFNGNTPRLRTCSFTSFHFGWDSSLLRCLRVLKLGGYITGAPSPSVILRILRSCPQLEELNLRNLSGYDGGGCFPKDEVEADVRTKAIPLVHLKKIVFYYSGITLARVIMDNILFPALEALELHFLENITPILQSIHVQAQKCLLLRHLRIESCTFNAILLAKILRRTSSLASLTLVDAEDVSSSLFKSLSSSSSVALPRLESLVLDQCTNFNGDSLRTFVESRFANKRPRRSTIDFTVPPPVQRPKTSRPRSHTTEPVMYLSSCRLEHVDVTRCHQIGKDMVNWLKMYVTDVRCDPGRDVLGGC